MAGAGVKILFASFYDDANGVGGVEQVVYDLSTGMKRMYGDEVACAVNPGELSEMLKKQGIPVTEIAFSKARTLEAIGRLGRLIREFKPDVVFSHHRFMTFLLDHFFRNQTYIVHTEALLRRNKKLLFRYGHLAVACHESVRENLIKHYGVPAEKTLTIDNTVSQPALNPERRQGLEAIYPRKPGQLYGLCIGRLEDQKGHKYLIEALSKLDNRERSLLRIFLAGEGSLKLDLLNDAVRFGTGSSLTFLGYTHEAAEWLDFCDFVILPSLWEGSPLTLRLAYGASRPLLASDIEGVKEYISPGKTGWLFAPRDPDALADVLRRALGAGQEGLRSMGREAHAYWQEHFTVEKMVAAYHQICETRAGRVCER